MRFSYTRVDRWPPLAWLATCRPGSSTIEVAHGSLVEIHPEWFGEAVWDGPYEDAEFDRTDLVFGSAARLRGRAATFVSSASTVDRLHSLETAASIWISNSLACLLAGANADVDPGYPRYFQDFETIIHGIDRYQRTIDSSAGPVRLTYYRNLQWSGDRLAEVAKPFVTRDFGTFAAYRDFVEHSLIELARNMKAEARQHPYEMLATASSGYDSLTGAALARRAGLRQTLSFSHARDSRDDSGAAAARILGLDPLVIDSMEWRKLDLPEVPFLASDAKGEDVYYAAAADLLRGRLLLTGYSGSRVWAKGTAPSENLERSDQSGLSLCEFRLWAGFVHCPVPFIGGRQTLDLRRISHSPEMTPWDVSGEYSRPICRRVLEEAGVHRHLFGMQKKAASILLFNRRSFLSTGSVADYIAWLDAHRAQINGGRRPLAGIARSVANTAIVGARRTVGGLQQVARSASELVPLNVLVRLGKSHRLSTFANYEPAFRHHVFPWALGRARDRYRA